MVNAVSYLAKSPKWPARLSRVGTWRRKKIEKQLMPLFQMEASDEFLSESENEYCSHFGKFVYQVSYLRTVLLIWV